MSYVNKQTKFSGKDGVQLFCQSWKQAQFSPARSVVIIHGMMEHCDRYGNVLDAFENDDLSFFSFDLRGHGRSGEKQGDIQDLSLVVDDIVSYLEFLKEEEGIDKPLMIAHSFGGLMALSFALDPAHRKLIKALMTSAAVISAKMNLGMYVKQFLARFVLKKISPKLILPVGLDAHHISHDLEAVELYKKDPMVFDKISVALAAGTIEEGLKILDRADEIKDIPVYMAHGEDDQIAIVEGTKKVFAKIKSTDKTLKLYPGLYHEIFNEVPAERQKVLSDLRPWVLEHI